MGIATGTSTVFVCGRWQLDLFARRGRVQGFPSRNRLDPITDADRVLVGGGTIWDVTDPKAPLKQSCVSARRSTEAAREAAKSREAADNAPTVADRADQGGAASRQRPVAICRPAPGTFTRF